jgi:hypothetical protein
LENGCNIFVGILPLSPFDLLIFIDAPPALQYPADFHLPYPYPPAEYVASPNIVPMGGRMLRKPYSTMNPTVTALPPTAPEQFPNAVNAPTPPPFWYKRDEIERELPPLTPHYRDENTKKHNYF